MASNWKKDVYVIEEKWGHARAIMFVFQILGFSLFRPPLSIFPLPTIKILKIFFLF